MLIDAGNYSEEFRHECEVRYVVAMPSKIQQNQFLAGVRKQRGDKAWKRLEHSSRPGRST